MSFLRESRWNHIASVISNFLTAESADHRSLHKLKIYPWEERAIFSFVYGNRLNNYGLPIQALRPDAFPALFYRFTYGSTDLSVESGWDANQLESSSGLFATYLQKADKFEKRFITFGIEENGAYAFAVEIIRDSGTQEFVVRYGILAPSRDYRLLLLSSIRNHDDGKLTKAHLAKFFDAQAMETLTPAIQPKKAFDWLEAHDLGVYEFRWANAATLEGFELSKGRARQVRAVRSNAQATMSDLQSLGFLGTSDAEKVTPLFRLQDQVRAQEERDFTLS